MKLIGTFFPFIIILCVSAVAIAQPSNDNCETAYKIPTPTSFCGDFNNIGATVNTLDKADCFSSNGKDVWFVFTATGTEVQVDITSKKIGNIAALNRIEAAIYSGTCGNFGVFPCPVAQTGLFEVSRAGIQPGETYFIRVQGENNSTGGFQLCVKNFNPPSSFDADCVSGPALCDKSAFAVSNLTNPGKDATDLNDATCFGNNGLNNETRSHHRSCAPVPPPNARGLPRTTAPPT